jgi:6-phosphogluconolactonase
VVLALTEDGDIGEVTEHLIHPGHGPLADRQNHSHVHQAAFDPAGKHLLVTDLGTDRIHTYTLDADGRLRPDSVTSVPAGYGSRHLTFVGTSTVITTDELSSTVSWYDYEPEIGRLTWRGSEPTVSRVAGVNYPSDLAIAGNGTVCLVGNRGQDTIGVFTITAEGLSRTAELDSGGHWPQHFATVGTDVWFALRDSDRIGALRVTGTRAELLDFDIALPRPNWILEGHR